MRQIVFIFLITSSGWVAAQEQQYLSQGDLLYNSGNYYDALISYERALQYKEDNIYTHLQLAKCYLLSSPKTRALRHAQKAIELSVQPTSEMYFVLARAYHINNDFDNAIKYYQKSAVDETQKKSVAKHITECQNAKKYFENKINADIINMGKNINTEESEHMPFITADRHKIFFTSTRSAIGEAKRVDKDGMNFEDIYVSTFKKGVWENPRKIHSICSEGHDACAGISNDGLTMFVYKGTNGGDLYVSELKGARWSTPVSLSINTHGFEGSASLSPDGKTLYFVHKPVHSDNRDIYKSVAIAPGKWGKPERINEICTEYDEDCPYIHPDGKTLYFSSKGHSTMGGYDIFKSVLQPNGTWSKPVNIGYPINTTSDDLNFTLTADGKYGYYSSGREGGYGKHDLYTIRFNTETQKEHDLQLLVGDLIDEATGSPLEADIIVTDNHTSRVIATYRSNAEDGHFVVPLPCGLNYNIHIEKSGYLFYSENVNLECATGYSEKNSTITMQVAKSGAKIVLNNIFFDFGKSELNRESTVELMQIVNFLNKNPSLKIEISGHTDSIGNEDDNLLLSENRALRVKNFLIAQGISPGRLVAKGYGSTMPLSSNLTEEGRRKNRRTEFKIL
ncbi:MAG: OmpA family protein [Cytophagaceae bacterium]|nr:OmpA family protein [Cytophagaceae bacterium]MDW8456632.1 OmpA family protein [Cytophagaceae bacterium]